MTANGRLSCNTGADMKRQTKPDRKPMGKMTMRFMLLLAAMLLGGADRLAAQELPAQEKVEAQGITSTIKLEELVYGHLAELNGKFKLRATEVTFAPEAYLGAHHHVGPGIRYVLAGEVTFTEVGQATIYKAGDYFFESGNVVHTAQNKTKLPLVILFVEILPKDWDAPTVIPPKL
jgi:quercetin dioxygenase-like cupin family protein